MIQITCSIINPSTCIIWSVRPSVLNDHSIHLYYKIKSYHRTPVPNKQTTCTTTNQTICTLRQSNCIILTGYLYQFISLPALCDSSSTLFDQTTCTMWSDQMYSIMWSDNCQIWSDYLYDKTNCSTLWDVSDMYIQMTCTVWSEHLD
jgi:hypothetical protein